MKTIRLSEAGGHQIVEIPGEFRLASDAVQIRREGTSLVLTPIPESWRPLLDSLELFSDDFLADGRQQLPQQIRESFLS